MGEALNSIEVSLLGAQATAFDADEVADSIEETGRGREIHFASTFTHH
jgi:hypothetical protein